MSKIDEIRLKQERIARQIEAEKRATPPALPTPVCGGGFSVTVACGQEVRARTQEAGAGSDISVKLLNPFDAEVGSAFDVYAFLDKSSSDMADFYPQVADDQVVGITRYSDENWYLTNPNLQAVTSIKVQTHYHIDGANQKFQKKYRTNVKVFAADAESAYSDIHTGSDCD